MKDLATMENEMDYLVMEMTKAKADREYLMRFVARLLHPEDFGWAVDQEVREEARWVLQEVQR